MDEPTQRYREIRSLLAALVACWPWNRPGAAYENAKIYLDFHCADCGIKLSVNDLAVVLELEMLRLGTVDTRHVPYYDPICARCYVVRAGPECHSHSDRGATLPAASIELLPAQRDASDIIHIPDGCRGSSIIASDRPFHETTDAIVLPERIGSQDTPMPRSPRLRNSRYLHCWQADLIIAATMLVLLLVVAILVFQPARHAVSAPPGATPAARPLDRQGVARPVQTAGVLPVS